MEYSSDTKDTIYDKYLNKNKSVYDKYLTKDKYTKFSILNSLVYPNIFKDLSSDSMDILNYIRFADNYIYASHASKNPDKVLSLNTDKSKEDEIISTPHIEIISESPKIAKNLQRSYMPTLFEYIRPVDMKLYNYIKSQEEDYDIGSEYILTQPDINKAMRTILISWIFEVAYKKRIWPGVVHHAVNLIDRYLERTGIVGKPIKRSNLQLVGISALYFAYTYSNDMAILEYSYSNDAVLASGDITFDANDASYVTANAYTRKQVIDMANSIPFVLDWKIGSYLTSSFYFLIAAIPHINKMLKSKITAKQFNQCCYLLMEMLCRDSFKFSPSMQACVALYIVLNRNLEILKFFGYYHSKYRIQVSKCLDSMIYHLTKDKYMAAKDMYPHVGLSDLLSK